MLKILFWYNFSFVIWKRSGMKRLKYTVRKALAVSIYLTNEKWRYCKALCDVKVSSNRGKWANISSHRAKQLRHQVNFLTVNTPWYKNTVCFLSMDLGSSRWVCHNFSDFQDPVANNILFFFRFLPIYFLRKVQIQYTVDKIASGALIFLSRPEDSELGSRWMFEGFLHFAMADQWPCFRAFFASTIQSEVSIVCKDFILLSLGLELCTIGTIAEQHYILVLGRACWVPKTEKSREVF